MYYIMQHVFYQIFPSEILIDGVFASRFPAHDAFYLSARFARFASRIQLYNTLKLIFCVSIIGTAHPKYALRFPMIVKPKRDMFCI